MGGTNGRLLNRSRLDGKTALVTGCNIGIGKVTAKELYRLGARVIMACRDLQKAQEAADSIKNELASEENVGELVIKHLNLASLISVRACADDINRNESKLNLLINNAGVMMCPKGQTEDGFEVHFGVNHLGHFLLTNLLLPKMIESAPSRIINVSSKIFERGVIHWDDPNYEKIPYSGFDAYAQSKLANVLFTLELTKRLKDKNVAAFSVHPGIVRTELGRHLDTTYFPGARKLASFLFWPFFKTPEDGALTTLYCALKDDLDNSGCYFADCELKKTFENDKIKDDASKLWEVSRHLVQTFLPE